MIPSNPETKSEDDTKSNIPIKRADMLDVSRRPIVNTSYEKPFNWYYLVFKPFNASYAKYEEWYQTKGIEYVRRQFDYEMVFITRETIAAKTHLNMIIASKQDLSLQHDEMTRNFRYKIHVQTLPKISDRDRAYDYITKESHTRPFERYIDWYYHCKKKIPVINFGYEVYSPRSDAEKV